MLFRSQLGINKGYTNIPVLVNMYGLLHFIPIQVKTASNNKFMGTALGSCAQMLDIPTLTSTRYPYAYTQVGDLDIPLLIKPSLYQTYETEYKVLGRIYPVTNIKVAVPLKPDDILLSCPGINPPLPKEICEGRLR